MSLISNKKILKTIVYTLFCANGFCATTAYASNNQTLTPDLMNQAITLAAQADVYSAYCGSNATLTDLFFNKFKSHGVDPKMLETLQTSHQNTMETTQTALKEKKPDCKDIAFMLERFNIMKNLKHVSFQISGQQENPKTQSEFLKPEEIQLLFPPEQGEIPDLNTLPKTNISTDK